MHTAVDGFLMNRLAFESSDVDIVRAQISRYFKPHKLSFLDAQRHLNTSLRRAKLGAISINLLEYGGNVMVDPGPLEDFYLIHLNLAGECEITHDGGHMTVKANQGAVCTPHRPYRFWWQPQSSVLAIQIPRQRLVAHLQDITGIVAREDVEFDFKLDLERVEMGSFQRLLNYLLKEASYDYGLTGDSFVAESLERALMTALLRTQPNSHQATLSMTAGNAAPGYVVRAEAFMRENLHRAIRLEELARVGDVTERTITAGFRRFRGEPPARHFLAMRLAEVRRRLLASNGTAVVSDTAFELGFHHLSSFSAAYRARYNETPSQTVRRLQQ